MRGFKIIVMLSWIAAALNLVLFMVLPVYSRHVPYEIEGLLFIGALLLSAVYKVSKAYQTGMNR